MFTGFSTRGDADPVLEESLRDSANLASRHVAHQPVAPVPRSLDAACFRQAFLSHAKDCSPDDIRLESSLPLTLSSARFHPHSPHQSDGSLEYDATLSTDHTN